MTLVRQDAEGLFVRAGGYVFRPGPVRGYSHAFEMDDGGLKAGDHVHARHVAGSQLGKLKLLDGSGKVKHWFGEGNTRNRDLEV